MNIDGIPWVNYDYFNHISEIISKGILNREKLFTLIVY